MSIEKYLEMNLNELYQFLISDVMADVAEGKKLIEALAKTDRYLSDFEFRASVETSRAIVYGISGQNSQLISLCTELIENCTALKLWQLVSTNWNLLGTAYSACGLYERSMECFYNVIKNEKSHDLIAMTSIAYNNIAIIYANFRDDNKTLENLTKAIEALEKGGPNQPRYFPKMILYLSNMVTTLSKTKRLEEIPPVLERIQKLGIIQADQATRHSYYSGMMYYYFGIGDYQRGKAAYYLSRSLLNNNNFIYIFTLMANYIELCAEAKLDLDFYSEELLSLKSQESAERALPNIQVYNELRKYYQAIDDRENFALATEKYIYFLEKDAENVQKSHAESLYIVENIILDHHNINDILSKNTELELIADEAIRHKNLLQEAYSRLEKMSSLDGLTQISNRKTFNDKVKIMFEEAQKSAAPIFILMIDIDNFKAYNDNYGHLEGDEALKTVAAVFQSNMDPIDGLSARFGGEEFIGACLNFSLEEAQKLAEQMRQQVYFQDIEHVGNATGRLTVSVGLSYTQNASTFELKDLIKIADQALYEAKGNGRNQVVVKDN